MKFTLEQLPPRLKDATIEALASLLSDLSHGSPLPPPGEPAEFLAAILGVLLNTRVDIQEEVTH